MPARAVLGFQHVALSADRGIGRYSVALANALHARAPERVVRADAEGPEAMEALSPRMPVPMAVARNQGRPAGDGRLVYHVSAPLVPRGTPLRTIWPRWAQASDVALAVTLYDLIEARHPDRLPDHEVRALEVRLELLREADAVLTISRAVAEDAVQILGLPRTRVHAVGAAAIPGPPPPEDPLAAARAAVARLGRDPIVAPLGDHWRKNAAGLLRAYAELPRELRERHQLVVLGFRLDAPSGRWLAAEAARIGVGDTTLFPPRLDDAALAALLASAGVVVFPSLEEGYGLPVAEAIEAGAPVVASDIPSVREILPDDSARFDPADPAAIAAALRDALEHPKRRTPPDDPPSWDAVAERTLAAWDEAAAVRAERRGGARRRGRPAAGSGRRPLAILTPLPPIRSGIASYSDRLLEAIRGRAEVRVYEASAALEAAAALEPGLPEPITVLGNNDHHLRSLEAFLRMGGVAHLHDTDLSHLAGLHRRAAGGDGDGRRLLARIACRADLVLVHSETGRDAVLSAHGDANVAVVPFGIGRAPVPAAPTGTSPVVASLGHVRRADLLVASFAALHAAMPRVRLVVAGPSWGDGEAAMRRQLAEASLEDVVELTNWLDDDAYEELLGRITVAVQLRDRDSGERSAAAGDLLGAGVPTVVNDLGAHARLPEDVVRRVRADPSPHEVAEAIAGLLHDPDERARLRAEAVRYAADHTFEAAADGLLAALSASECTA
ncbi:MAG TPA: glycosyltransferase [Thermoleophilaceae bacterium]|nr:glycosyltransferase [Thermoleophilaceae bacterium]